MKHGKLWGDTAAIRDRGGKVRLAYNKIKVDDVLYNWDDLQARIPVNRLPERRDINLGGQRPDKKPVVTTRMYTCSIASKEKRSDIFTHAYSWDTTPTALLNPVELEPVQ